MSLPAGYGSGPLPQAPSVSDLIGRTVAATESLPPSVLTSQAPVQGGGGSTVSPDTDITASFFGSDPVPQTATDLETDPKYGTAAFTGAAFKPGEFILTGSGAKRYWDGTQWKSGSAPAVTVTTSNPSVSTTPGSGTSTTAGTGASAT